MKKLTLLPVLAILASVYGLHANSQTIEPFRLSQITILDGPFKHAQEMDLKYLLEHDADRYLAPFRKDAGLEPKAPQYGNWENTGLDGHSAGHYLSALSMMYAATQDQECLKRANYMVDELALCQEKNGNGYVGGIPDSKPLWNEIESGKIKAESFSLNKRWVPWYNLHKTYQGLLDAYRFTGNQKALVVLEKLCGWAYELTKNLSDDQIQTMLKTEHGGMNEVFADVYAITKDERYLILAKRFSHKVILDPLIQRHDQLNGLHANTQIPKVIGFKRIADLTGDTAWKSAASFFFNDVVNQRSVTIGGNSVREHFHPANDFSSMIESNQGPETCNTYNMLKLAKSFYLSGDGSSYIDYYERALFNHILSSQNPDNGGLVYFTPMRPRHYRVYSKANSAFWCCVGTGMENHAKYGELIYAHRNNDLFVNLFISSVLNWSERNIKLTQETKFPDQNNTHFELQLVKKQKFAIKIRQPEWVQANEMTVTINGKLFKPSLEEKGYLTLNRTWNNGDKIDVQLPMSLKLVDLPDHSGYASLMYGPIVLSAATDTTDLTGLIADDSRMGHVANGPYYPLDEAPMLVFNGDDWKSKLEKVPGDELAFTTHNLIYPDKYRDLKLVPFYKIHDCRYMVYWKCTTPEGLTASLEKIKKAQQEILELEARTIDQVAPGEQQPESDHFYKGENTNSGVNQDHHWRDASGWFSYNLNTKGNPKAILQITYFGLDANRKFDILLNNQLLAEVSLDGSHGNTFYTVNYPVPESIIQSAQNNMITLMFKAKQQSLAGGIYYVRLLKPE